MNVLHQGHESMHAEMVLIFFVTVIVAQLLLFEWKRRYPKSYQVSNHYLSFPAQNLLLLFFVFEPVIFLSRLKHPLMHNWILISARHPCRDVVDTDRNVPQEQLVEIYIFLAAVLLYYRLHCSEGNSKTNQWHHAQVKLNHLTNVFTPFTNIRIFYSNVLNNRAVV